MKIFYLVLIGFLIGGCGDGDPVDRDTGPDGDADSDVDGDIDGDAESEYICDPDVDECCENSECSNGVYCDGLEVCDRGRCERGWPIDCDDGLECTDDVCDEYSNICVHVQDHDVCDDLNLCNGTERCSPGDEEHDENGCISGMPMVCDDGDDCTEDYCEDNECKIRVRDGDGDEHQDRNCQICDEEGNCVRGDDCDDNDATVYPGADEICDDGKDNNCDHDRDYEDPGCIVPNDTCSTALLLRNDVLIYSSTRGTSSDVSRSCGIATERDVVFYFNLTRRSNVTVEIEARTGQDIHVALTPDCGAAAATIACEAGRTFDFTRRSLIAGTYYLVVSAASEIDFNIRLSATPSGDVLDGDICASAIELTEKEIGTTIPVDMTGSGHDYLLSCFEELDLIDRVYVIDVGTEQTADFVATSEAGIVGISVQETCGMATTERGCWTGDGSVEGRVWRMLPGTYYVIVAHEEETTVEFTPTITGLSPDLYLSEDFSSDPIGWVVAGAWSQGIPSGGGGEPHPDFGGCIAASLGSTYPTSMSFTRDYAQSPPIDLRGATNPILTFRSWIQINTWGDGGTLQIATDPDGPYETLNHAELTPPYDGTVSSSRVWHGNHTWSDFSVPLTDYVDSLIWLRFSMVSDTWTEQQGWYVDSVLVIESE